LPDPREQTERQRIDRWLWHARIVRTRALAAALAQSGHVRVNGQRVTASSRPLRIGDVLTIALPAGVRVLRVQGFATRRGGAEGARLLFEDLSPSATPPDPPASGLRREPGAGRPTKRERRAIERLRQRGSGQRP
jgi:ribosome-associated heat shock protein Hsp15